MSAAFHSGRELDCGDTLELAIDTDRTPPIRQSGEVVVTNHGSTASITDIGFTRTDDLEPDFKFNFLATGLDGFVEPVGPGSTRTIESDLCGSSVDWVANSNDSFIFDFFEVPFPCDSQLDIFVNPDPVVAPDSEKGTLIFINNATEANSVLFNVRLRQSGEDNAVFGPGRFFGDENVPPGEESAGFDASPCDIEYDIRLVGAGGSTIATLGNAFIQCQFDTEIELVDDDF